MDPYGPVVLRAGEYKFQANDARTLITPNANATMLHAATDQG